ncbi:hypothetical protein BH09VER1_BH09VER1_48680 [soil metagenome]
MLKSLLALATLTAAASAAESEARNGAGFVIAPDGYLLTCRHIVEGAEKITARFADGRELPGTLVASGTSVDLALVKVDATGLPALPIAPAASAQVGDSVAVIGFPMLSDTAANLAASPTRITALSVLAGTPLLQLGFTLHPGHSGGPVLNSQGQVIGIANTRQFVLAGRFGDRLNLAIPADQAAPLIQQAIPHLDVPPILPADSDEKAIWQKAAASLVSLHVQAAPGSFTAPLPPIVSADKYPPALAPFLQAYALSPTSTSPEYVASFYHSPADYFGRSATTADIIEDARTFQARWPDRQYVPTPEGILVVPDPQDPQRFIVYYDLLFSYQNGDLAYSGVAAYTVTISTDAAHHFQVLSSTEKILSKSESTAQPIRPSVKHPK